MSGSSQASLHHSTVAENLLLGQGRTEIVKAHHDDLCGSAQPSTSNFRPFPLRTARDYDYYLTMRRYPSLGLAWLFGSAKVIVIAWVACVSC